MVQPSPIGRAEDRADVVDAADIVEYLDDRNLEKATIVGHSMGGKIAMQVALNHDERVENLVVVDIAPRAYSSTFFVHVLDSLLSLKLSDFTTRKDIELALKELIPEASTRLFLMKNLSRDLDNQQFYWKANLPVIQASLEEMTGFSGGDLPYMGATLFIRGGNSKYVKDEAVSDIKSLFPFAEVETVEGAAHWVHAERPQEFYAVLNGFLNDNIV